MAELFGHYRIDDEAKSHQIVLAGSRILLEAGQSGVTYRRFEGEELKTQASISSRTIPVVFGVFPTPPIFTPKQVSKNMYLKFGSPVIVDQRSEVMVYAKMPIEVGVFRQSDDEEFMIDAFSPSQQKYALYGSPDSGVVCRYSDTVPVSSHEELKPEKYREAAVSILIRNGIDNIVRVSKVIIPLDGVVLDHAHDDSWLSGSVEMSLDSAFGKDIVSVRLVNAKVKRLDKTSLLKREDTRTFLMDAGY